MVKTAYHMVMYAYAYHIIHSKSYSMIYATNHGINVETSNAFMHRFASRQKAYYQSEEIGIYVTYMFICWGYKLVFRVLCYIFSR